MATYWENSCSFGLRYVSWYKYLIVSLVFSHLGFWSGNLFLIAPFPDLCLLVPFHHRWIGVGVLFSLYRYYFLSVLVDKAILNHKISKHIVQAITFNILVDYEFSWHFENERNTLFVCVEA